MPVGTFLGAAWRGPGRPWISLGTSWQGLGGPLGAIRGGPGATWSGPLVAESTSFECNRHRFGIDADAQKGKGEGSQNGAQDV